MSSKGYFTSSITSTGSSGATEPSEVQGQSIQRETLNDFSSGATTMFSEGDSYDSGLSGSDTDDGDMFSLASDETNDSSDSGSTLNEGLDEQELEGLEQDAQIPLEILAADQAKNLPHDEISDNCQDEVEDNRKPKEELPHIKLKKYIDEKCIVFVSLDIEHGGDKCGICQISADFTTHDGTSAGQPFNEYVRPPQSAIWSQASIDVHGLHKNDPRIKEADPIEAVWARFVDRVESIVEAPKHGVIVAWNGKFCDME